MVTRVSVVGTGRVGSTLGGRLLSKGYKICYGSRDPHSERVQALLQAQDGACAATVQQSTDWGEVILLAVPGVRELDRITEMAYSLGRGVAGKLLIDATNPFGPNLQIAWDNSCAGAECLQSLLHSTHVFKAFNTIGVEHMAHPDGSLICGQRLTMMYAGDIDHKDTVHELIEAVGFIPKYMGGIRYARNLEAIGELWVHLAVGHARKDWKAGRNFNFQLLEPPDAN